VRLITTLKVENELGEGVVWDAVRSKVWWTDIQGSKLYRYDPSAQTLELWDTPERLCCFAPRANGQGLVAAFESGFAFYTPEAQKLEWIEKIEANNPGTRLNDGRTDRQGRLWAGTMVENQDTASQSGCLYCLDHDLTVRRTIGELVIPNSLCWSPDGTTMYHTDTPTRQINKYDYDVLTGRFGQASIFTETEQDCYPDGSIIDSQGYLWNAQWGGGQIVRYAPNGKIDQVVTVPTSQPSCVAFGGAKLNLLFITSAWQDLDDAARTADPEAGNFFIYETEYVGLIESGFIES